MKIEYSMTDFGRFGKATEKSLKEALGLVAKVAKQGQTDLRKARVCYEVKTGAGELGNIGEKLVKGSTMVIYIPVVDENATIDRQEGFVLSRELFLATLEACGLIREKTSTAGVRKITIQTFWNRAQNKPHGKGYARLLEAFYGLTEEGEASTLQEWLAEML